MSRHSPEPAAGARFLVARSWWKWLIAALLVAPLPVAAGAVARPKYEDVLRSCRVIDGDTIRCGRERIRLLGVDAPELPGHCRLGRDCVPGDPFASKASLADAMIGRLMIHRVGEDRYGRTLALVSGARGDLSCWQLMRGRAIYKPNWDDEAQLARVCPANARAGVFVRLGVLP